MLNYDDVMKIADKKYKELKAEKNPYTAPELLPDGIVSDQIRALTYALVLELNKELDKYKKYGDDKVNYGD